MQSYLYHAANFDPEVQRIARAYRAGDTVSAELFKQKTLAIVARVLDAPDISPAGKEEWGAVGRLVSTYEKNDTHTNTVLTTYGAPFSMRFALSR